MSLSERRTLILPNASYGNPGLVQHFVLPSKQRGTAEAYDNFYTPTGNVVLSNFFAEQLDFFLSTTSTSRLHTNAFSSNTANVPKIFEYGVKTMPDFL